MTQTSRFWWENAVGDAADAPWDTEEITRFVLLALHRYSERTEAMVLGGILNELEVVDAGSNVVRVQSGYAVVDGTIYYNSGNVDQTLTPPGGGTDYYRIILRKSWSAQTVIVTKLGPAAGGPYPSLTQTYLTTWEVNLADLTLTSGGVMTITDQRKITSAGGYQRLIVPSGSSYIHIQCGTIQWTGAAIDRAIMPVTFPTPFDSTPTCFTNIRHSGGKYSCVDSVNTTTLNIFWRSDDGNMTAVDLFWLAIGEVTPLTV